MQTESNPDGEAGSTDDRSFVQRNPWFPVYVQSFLSSPSVADMCDAEVGQFWLLLLYQWEHGGIPSAGLRLNQVAKIPRSRREDVRSINDAGELTEECLVSNLVMAEFPKGVNPRLDKERRVAKDKALERSQRSAKAGKAGAAARWAKGQKKGKAKSKATGKPKTRLWEDYEEQVPESVRDAFRDFAAYRNDINKPLTHHSMKSWLKIPAPQLQAAWCEAMQCGWQGPQFKNWTAEGQPARARGAGTVDPFAHLDTLDDDDLPRVIDAEVVK
jgi:hypothetical protein